ncbi:hypothetical protein PG999_001503 [Apiospora kogelbergensis]|uniref:Heterokaryon incompatibility domain-containing protein n=1 Tax=Apiospora kogelbergensis TaxID=1337665 RepID=A0AAW0REH0_9PEZI
MTGHITNPRGCHNTDASPIYRLLDQDRKEIRLFELFPADDDNALVQGRLRHHSLSDKPVYNTVSYVWGDPNLPKKNVAIDGKLLGVTANLYTLLCNLRASKEDTLLWIDAVCINQEDLAERSHQVAMMRQIYEHCREDLVWLGPTFDAEEGHGDAMEAGLQLLGKISANDIRDLQGLGSFFPDPPPTEETRLMETLSQCWMITDEESPILETVMVHPKIWDRIWVVQELACAPRVTLLAGKARLEWDRVARFLGPLPPADAFHFSLGSHANPMAIEYTTLLERVKRFDDQRTLTQKGGRQELFDILARWSGSDSSDPRDRIYGGKQVPFPLGISTLMTGLLCAVLGLAPQELAIPVDYSRTLQEVYIDVARAIIDYSANLDIIAQNPWRHKSSQEHHVQSSPSWVPSFFTPLSTTDTRQRLLFAQRGIFNAGPSTCQVPCIITNGHSLQTRGVVLDTIGKAIPRPVRWDPSENFSSVWMHSGLGEALLDKSYPVYVTGEPAFTAFWRTMSTDRTGFPMKRLQVDEIGVLDASFRDRVKQATIGPRTMTGLDTTSGEDSKIPSQQKLPYLFEDTGCCAVWRFICTQWEFNVTEKGLYTMLLGDCARQGDTIACLEGAKIPMILRELAVDELSEEDVFRFEVIGPAYVHGFMDMEAFNSTVLRERLGLKTEEIFLV